MKTLFQRMQIGFMAMLICFAMSSCAQQPTDKNDMKTEPSAAQATNTEPANEQLNNSEQLNQQVQAPDASQYANSNITYKIIPALNNTWGYEIYNEEKLMISQKSIPALPGNDGFKTEAQAKQVADMVIGKIKKGEMPPTVSVEELNNMGIK